MGVDWTFLLSSILFSPVSPSLGDGPIWTWTEILSQRAVKPKTTNQRYPGTIWFWFVGIGWLVGCFGFNGPLRRCFSLYRAVSQREGERNEKRYMREKMSKQPPPAPTASAISPCPTIIQSSRTPRHCKFTQHLCSTRPPPVCWEGCRRGIIV